MYLLLNKDIPWAEFEIVNEFGEDHVNVIKCNKSKIYPWIKDLDAFIKNRRAPKHRKHIENLLKQCGCDTLSGFLDVQHALQLNDTIWVKRLSDTLTWDQVQLYRNQFNQTIAKIAFQGGLFGQKFQSTSPEFGTDGQFAKCWARRNGKIILVKQGSTEKYINFGKEAYSEFYAQQVLEAFGVKHVKYGLTSHKGVIAQTCELFTSESVGLLPFSDISKDATFYNVIEMYKRLGAINELANMVVADALIFNTDRHLGNFGFLIDNDQGNIIQTAPLYDHNLQMLCRVTDDNLVSRQAFDKYCSDSGFGPCMYDNFITTAKQVMNNDIKSRLIRMKGFKLKKHTRYNLQDDRINKLNKLINSQIDLLLE